MKKIKRLKKVLSVVLCFALVVSLQGNWLVNVGAVTQGEIDEADANVNNAYAEWEKATQRVTEIQAKIDENQARIGQINATIEANKAAIEQTKEDIETDKLEFQKRLRSIYMSNSESRIKILLGAKSFSEFLQLAQLTASVSSYDKKLIESRAEQIKNLEAKNEENKKLKSELEEKQAELDKQREESEAEQKKAKELLEHNQSIADRLKAEKAAADNRRAGSVSVGNFDGVSGFIWPSYCYGLTAAFMGNDSVHNGRHFGVDIGASRGTEILSIGDGIVESMNNTCPHTQYGGCGCGGGYGNFAQINYGTINGNTYSAIYGHATSIIVSPGEHVSKGQVIGYVGTTGFSTGPHIHFGLIQNGSWIDAQSFYENSYGTRFTIWY